MSKRQLKTRIAVTQNNVCDITGQPLPTDISLMDTDRILPKAQNGTYTDENTRVVDPVAHMERHGILRTRTEALDELKSLFDDRVQMMKLMLKENNQLLAYERKVDHQHTETATFLHEHLKPIEQRIDAIDREIGKMLKTYPDPLVQTALKVPGLGPITVAALTVYIDFEKQVCNRCHRAVRPADFDVSKNPTMIWCTCDGEIVLTDATANPSSLWKYVGLHTASHDRYTKGEAGGGNKTLRTVLWNTANVMMKLGHPLNQPTSYRTLYDQVKQRLSVSEKIVSSRNTQGKLMDVAWKDTKPSHRHGAALRAIMKHILSDYWYVARTLRGQSVRPPYPVEYLGHTHTINPRDRGWQLPE